MRQVLKFALVGTTGFAVDVSIFTVLTLGLSLPIEWARVLAFLVAALVTWFGNRHFTFGSAKTNYFASECRRSLIVSCITGLINITIFKGMTLYSAEHLFVYVAFICGVLAGMIFNYLLSAWWVFNLKSA
ncbi:GtrA family protein [Pseudoalteromonas sp. SMS1]|uniref:GtrA family protein n=1 Tax=Pseudoalteromonas sp. SMS1 TaxID=2908894 RepID=UPI001F454761|nr:GtrA family protein [Pseudoalteromonas sp. SMS1]MCF2858737.1 GtrA family protein [Pseudoalteromonas sp. SMS1]